MEHNGIVETPGEAPPALGKIDAASVKEYLLGLMSGQKLAEKQLQELEQELDKWNSRMELARSKGRDELAQEAETEIERLKGIRQKIKAEIAEYVSLIRQTRQQLPLLAARERSVDPDLLEQELLIMTGRLPGEEDQARAERAFRAMETEVAADAALAELKAKMGKTAQPEQTEKPEQKP